MEVKTYVERTIGDFKDADGTFIENYRRSLEGLSSEARKVLDIFSRAEDGTICGSNDFAPIWVYTHGLLRLASPNEFSMAFNDNPENWKGCYRDAGILFSPMNSEGNKLLNNNLERALKDAGIQIGNVPLFLPFTSFDLIAPKKSEKSNYSLVHVVANSKEIIEAPMLARDAKIKKYSTLERGLPVPDENGKYPIYFTDRKVAGLIVYRGLYFNSRNDDLANSNSNGRMAQLYGQHLITNNINLVFIERFLNRISPERL